MRRVMLVSICAAALLAVAAAPAGASAAAQRPAHTEPFIPGGGAAPRAVGARAAVVNGTTTTSVNWSGYDTTAVGTYKFGSVSATWVQPPVRVSGQTLSDASFWVGIDGDPSETVEQIGTDGYSEFGTAYYDAWYELFPGPSVPIAMTIHPGDVMTATVAWAAPAQYTLTLTDTTTSQTFSTVPPLTFVSDQKSAEVIAEAPSTDAGVLPLNKFGLVSFSGCSFDGQPISAYDWNRIDMTDSYSGAAIDKTSYLGADGASFSVTTDVTPPHTTVVGADGRWHDHAVGLRFVAHDNSGGQGVASTSFSTDGGTTWTTGTTLTVPAPADHSGDGVRTVRYYSIDKVGNVEVRRTCRVLIDTRRPTPVANWAGFAHHDSRCALRYLVRDPRPGSPNATVTIRIVNSHGKLVYKRAIARVAVDRLQTYDFTCLLPRGRYRFTVAATDQAGNPQTTAAGNTLVVR